MTTRRAFLISCAAVTVASRNEPAFSRTSPGIELLDDRGRRVAVTPEGDFAVSIAMVNDRKRRKIAGLEKFVIEYKHTGSARVVIAKARKIGEWPSWADDLRALDNIGTPITLYNNDTLHLTWQVFTHKQGSAAITDV